jgi:hypothetical protein
MWVSPPSLTRLQTLPLHARGLQQLTPLLLLLLLQAQLSEVRG